MFFSIIIPIHNSEKYLRQCIDSILTQTCRDFEEIGRASCRERVREFVTNTATKIRGFM